MADLLSHRAGLAWVDGTMSFEDMVRWDPVVEALERQEPSWPPGTAHGYHATTYGWLVGEVVRRVTGDERRHVPAHARWRTRWAPTSSSASRLRGAPGGAPGVVHRRPHSRARQRSAGGQATDAPGGTEHGRAGRAGQGPTSPRRAPCSRRCRRPAVRSPTRRSGTAPDSTRRRSPPPTASAIARSLALLYGACVDDVKTSSGDVSIVTPEQVDRAVQQETKGPDEVLMGLDIQWGLGFNVNSGIIGVAGLGGPEGVRAFRHGRIGGMGGPRLGTGHGIRDEPDGHRDHGGHPELPAHALVHRCGGECVVNNSGEDREGIAMKAASTTRPGARGLALRGGPRPRDGRAGRPGAGRGDQHRGRRHTSLAPWASSAPCPHIVGYQCAGHGRSAPATTSRGSPSETGS